MTYFHLQSSGIVTLAFYNFLGVSDILFLIYITLTFLSYLKIPPQVTSPASLLKTSIASHLQWTSCAVVCHHLVLSHPLPDYSTCLQNCQLLCPEHQSHWFDTYIIYMPPQFFLYAENMHTVTTSNKASSLLLGFVHEMQLADLSSAVKSSRVSVELLCIQRLSPPYGDPYRKGEDILQE